MIRKSPDPLFVLRGHTTSVTCLYHQPENEVCFSGDQSGELILWNMETHRSVCTLKRAHHGGVLETGLFSSDTLFSHGREGTISLFDMQATSTAKYHCASLTFMKASLASQDPPILFVPGENDSISLLDIRVSERLPFLDSNKRRGMVMGCSGALQNLCVVCYESGHACIVDGRTRSIVEETQVFKEPIISMAAASDLSNIACGSSKTDMAVLRRNSGRSVLQTLSTPSNGILSLSYRSDNRLIALGGNDGKVRLYENKSLRPLAILGNHERSVRVVRFSSDHSLLSGGDDANIMVWDIYKHGNRLFVFS